jgi:hypothetical protein
MDEIQSAAMVLFRYLTARALLTSGKLTLPAIADLKRELRGHRQRLIYGVLVDLDRSPILGMDDQDQELLSAINGQGAYRDHDAALMDQLRKHVYESGPLPVIPRKVSSPSRSGFNPFKPRYARDA